MRLTIFITNIVLIVAGIVLAFVGTHISSLYVEIGAAILLLATVGYLANSFHKVDLGNQAAITFGGEPVKGVESGWVYVPPVLYSLEELPTQFFTIMFGTLEDEGADHKGQVFHDRALRVTFAGKKKSKPKRDAKAEDDFGGDMNPLLSLLTTDPTVVIVMRILPGKSARFIKSVESIGNALVQLKHVTEGFLQGVVASITVEEARSRTTEISEKLCNEIKSLVKADNPDNDGAWAVEISVCRVTSWGLPRRINEALADVAKAIAGANEAEFKRITGFKQAAVEAEKQRLSGFAETEIGKAKAELAKTEEGRFVLMMETLNEMMHDVAQGKNTTLLTTAGDMGIENMLAKLLAMQSRLKFEITKEEPKAIEGGAK